MSVFDLHRRRVSRTFVQTMAKWMRFARRIRALHRSCPRQLDFDLSILKCCDSMFPIVPEVLHFTLAVPGLPSFRDGAR